MIIHQEINNSFLSPTLTSKVILENPSYKCLKYNHKLPIELKNKNDINEFKQNLKQLLPTTLLYLLNEWLLVYLVLKIIVKKFTIC